MEHTLTILTALLLAPLAVLHAAENRPNIVFVLADALDWSDTTLCGTTKFFEAPNIERLAARGIVQRQRLWHKGERLVK